MKTINGYILNEAAKKRQKDFGLIKLYQHSGGSGDEGQVKAATLIQWDGPTQRVFSEAEVKGLLQLACAVARLQELGDGVDGSPVDDRIRKTIAAKHNITL